MSVSVYKKVWYYCVSSNEIIVLPQEVQKKLRKREETNSNKSINIKEFRVEIKQKRVFVNRERYDLYAESVSYPQFVYNKKMFLLWSIFIFF